MSSPSYWTTVNNALNSEERQELNNWRHWTLHYFDRAEALYRQLVEKYDVPVTQTYDPFRYLSNQLSAVPAFDDPGTSLARLRNLAADASQALSDRNGDPATRAAGAAVLLGTILGEIRALTEGGYELVRVGAPIEGGEVSAAPSLVVNDVTTSGAPRLGGGLVEAAPD